MNMRNAVNYPKPINWKISQELWHRKRLLERNRHIAHRHSVSFESLSGIVA